jgi:cell division protein FtsL
MRITTIISLILLTISIVGLFQVKHRVLQLRGELAQLNNNIVEHQQTIHILHAEWAYLNQPKRLEKLAHKYLAMTSIEISHVHQGESDFLDKQPRFAYRKE